MYCSDLVFNHAKKQKSRSDTMHPGHHMVHKGTFLSVNSKSMEVSAADLASHLWDPEHLRVLSGLQEASKKLSCKSPDSFIGMVESQMREALTGRQCICH